MADLVSTKQELTEVREYHVYAEHRRIALQQLLQDRTEEYQKEIKANANAAANVIAKHTADNKRLLVKLAQADRREASTRASSDRPVVDDRAELHPETSEALIGITLDADSKVKALQDVIKLLNKSQGE